MTMQKLYCTPFVSCTANMTQGKTAPPDAAAVKKAAPLFVIRPRPRNEIEKIIGQSGPSKKKTMSVMPAIVFAAEAPVSERAKAKMEKTRAPKKLRRSMM